MKKAKVTKGVAEKQVAGKLLADVPEANVFFCNDGQIFRNTEELGRGLDSMSDETFFYHSNYEKYDFSNWLKDAVGDKELAANLVNVGNRMEAARIVSARIKSLQSKQGCF